MLIITALQSSVHNRSFCLRVFAVTFGAAFLHSLSRLYLPDITLIIRKKASCFICKTPSFSTIIYKLTEFVNKQHLTNLFIILRNNSIQLKKKLIYVKICLNFLYGEFNSLSLYLPLVCFLLSDLRVFSLLILDVLLSTFSKTKLMESMVK